MIIMNNQKNKAFVPVLKKSKHIFNTGTEIVKEYKDNEIQKYTNGNYDRDHETDPSAS